MPRRKNKSKLAEELLPKKNIYFWQAKPTRGRQFKYTDPQELLEDCTEYFEWCENNPIMESRILNTKDGPMVKEVPRMRAYTLMGLLTFLGINADTWISQWSKPGHHLSEVTVLVEQIIRNQKFTGAAAFQLQPNLIARDLGLADKQEVSSPDGSLGNKVAVVLPGVPGTLSMEEWTKAYQRMQLARESKPTEALPASDGERRQS